MSSPSFRDHQCERFNKWQFPEDGKFHRWKTHRILLGKNLFSIHDFYYYSSDCFVRNNLVDRFS